MFPSIRKALFFALSRLKYDVCLATVFCFLIAVFSKRCLFTYKELSDSSRSFTLRANAMSQEVLEDFKFPVTLSKCICIIHCRSIYKTCFKIIYLFFSLLLQSYSFLFFFFLPSFLPPLQFSSLFLLSSHFSKERCDVVSSRENHNLGWIGFIVSCTFG